MAKRSKGKGKARVQVTIKGKGKSLARTLAQLFRADRQRKDGSK
jgi:hypothetical protein